VTLAFRQVLAIETSCDDTSVAVVAADGFVKGVISAHQNQVHEEFGGIVPEIASRNHTHHLLPLVERVLKETGLKLTDIDGFAVTSKPGLIGSLLVGLVTAKSLALASEKPFIGVNHLEGHLLAPFLSDAQYTPPQGFAYPYIALAISGGHTSIYRIEGVGQYQVLGQTVDDAAGEAFDKFGKMLGLGFPGGARVDRLAKFGNPQRFQFPRPLIQEEHLHFSFSGMKTSAQRLLMALKESELQALHACAQATLDDPEMIAKAFGSGTASESLKMLADFSASFQAAMIDVLLDRLSRAVKSHGLSRAVLTGGVSANSGLRARAAQWAGASGVQLVVPPLRYCTDNAAMIGFAGIQRLNRGESSEQSLGPEARAPLGVAVFPKGMPDWLVKAKS
jgi:N6-L-threonylcarbamoyladenine synthase